MVNPQGWAKTVSVYSEDNFAGSVNLSEPTVDIAVWSVGFSVGSVEDFVGSVDVSAASEDYYLRSEDISVAILAVLGFR